jgi:hypothetical protein
MTTGGKWLHKLPEMEPLRRAVVVWLLFQAVLWLTFGLGYLTNPGAWVDAPSVPPSDAAVGGWLSTFLFIVVSNTLVTLIIVVGNVFVRFGWLTPGLLALLLQGVTIGWLAGTNGFEVPFASVAEANIQFLRVGLWETTAYALACAVTLPKSLFVSKTFPAKEWAEVHKLRDISFSSTEKALGLLTLVALLGAALVEANYLVG